MAIRLVIDGYNYICAALGLSGSHPGGMDPTVERDALLEKLVAYKKLKSAKITVVFDGTRSDNLYRSRGTERGIEVAFSRSGEEADTVIKEIAREQGSGLTVVTSDRELGSYCAQHGAVIVSSSEFHDRLSQSLFVDMKGLEEEDDEMQTPSGPGGKRKGPARKLSKKEREKRKKLKKL
ncbi:MAG: NYN domain-containing protein [Thermodesulfobacteriota bacterium]